MSERADPLVDELTIALGDLEVTVRRRPGATGRAESPEDEAFELVTDPGAAEPDRTPGYPRDEQLATAEPDLETRILQATTAEQLGEFDLAALRPLVRRLRSANAEWTAQARIVRAYRAGLAAKNKLAGRWGISAPASPEIPYAVRYYIVLRGRRGAPPFWTYNRLRFFDRVGGPEGRGIAYGVVCQGLPSQAEADAFLLGAEQPWPELVE
jgi:hypothetical protein